MILVSIFNRVSLLGASVKVPCAHAGALRVWSAHGGTHRSIQLQLLQERRDAERCSHDLLDQLCQDWVSYMLV